VKTRFQSLPFKCNLQRYSTVKALSRAGLGDSHRQKGKEYITRNVVPLMEATQRFMEGEMSELELIEELAREDASGWSVAGAKEALAMVKFHTTEVGLCTLESS
jgi:hypothetical protein